MTAVAREYRPSDREGFVGLWPRCGLTRAWNDPYLDIDHKVLRDAANLLVLEDDDGVVGSVMVGYEGHRGWVNYLAALYAWGASIPDIGAASGRSASLIGEYFGIYERPSLVAQCRAFLEEHHLGRPLYCRRRATHHA